MFASLEVIVQTLQIIYKSAVWNSTLFAITENEIKISQWTI